MDISAVAWYSEKAKSKRQAGLLYLTHDVIIGTLPQCTLSLKWDLPVYDYIKYLCYISYIKDDLYIGFTQGKYLTPRVTLDMKNTKLVAKYYIRDKRDIYESELIEILLEAEALQDSLYKK